MIRLKKRLRSGSFSIETLALIPAVHKISKFVYSIFILQVAKFQTRKVSKIYFTKYFSKYFKKMLLKLFQLTILSAKFGESVA